MRRDLGEAEFAIEAEGGLCRDDPQLLRCFTYAIQPQEMPRVPAPPVRRWGVELDDDCVAVLVHHELGFTNGRAVLVEEPTIEGPDFVGFGGGSVFHIPTVPHPHPNVTPFVPVCQVSQGGRMNRVMSDAKTRASSVSSSTRADTMVFHCSRVSDP